MTQESEKPGVHYHYGAGLHGSLYEYGPHTTYDYDQAVDDLADTHELGRRRRAQLKRDGYLEMNLHRDGNEYCEIVECNNPDCEVPSYGG